MLLEKSRVCSRTDRVRGAKAASCKFKSYVVMVGFRL